MKTKNDKRKNGFYKKSFQINCSKIQTFFSFKMQLEIPQLELLDIALILLLIWRILTALNNQRKTKYINYFMSIDYL